MKKLTIITLLIALSCNFLFAQKLKRVNNNGFDPDYTTLSAAVAAASNGDTIYVEGSAIKYPGCSINKQLTIIGPGYFLGENPKTQALTLEAKFNTEVTFASGSSGSTMMGCSFDDVYLTIGASNISLIRNQLNAVRFNANVNNILIMQNFVKSYISSDPGVVTNMVISNNIIEGNIAMNASSGGLIITNNVCTQGITTYGSTIQNNIIVYLFDIAVNSGNSISYNLFAKTGTNSNNNQYDVNMTNVFVGQTGNSADGQWKLAVGSPAIGAGSGGVDCGIYGGLTPYVLSGMPYLPHIYSADIPAAVSSGSTMGISIKVKSGD